MRYAELLNEGVEDRTFYHITMRRNVARVLQEGLIPRRGTRSRRMKENAAAIYLFPTLDDAETAFANWLGEEFSERTKLSLLKITLPHTIELHSDVPFECHVYDAIPPVCISLLVDDLDTVVSFHDI